MAKLHLVGADVLGDAARFAGCYVGFADGVEQRGLAVIDVAHDGDDRGTRNFELAGVLGFENFFDGLVGEFFFVADDGGAGAELGGHILDHLGVERLVDGDEDAAHEQGGDEVLGADFELLGQVLDADAFGHGDFAGDGQRLIAEMCGPAKTWRRHKALHWAFLGLGILLAPPRPARCWGALRARRFAGRWSAAAHRAGRQSRRDAVRRSQGVRQSRDVRRVHRRAAGPAKPGARSGAWDAGRQGIARARRWGTPGVRCWIAAGTLPQAVRSKIGLAALNAGAGCWAGGGAEAGATIGALYTGRGPVCGITTRRGATTGACRCGRRSDTCAGSFWLYGSDWVPRSSLRFGGDCLRVARLGGSATGSRGAAVRAFRGRGGAGAVAAGRCSLGCCGLCSRQVSSPQLRQRSCSRSCRRLDHNRRRRCHRDDGRVANSACGRLCNYGA